jgi:hypothetical protein
LFTSPNGGLQSVRVQSEKARTVPSVVRTDGFAFLFMTALARGAACNVDLSDDWHFWSVAARPLDEVRAELGVTPPVSAQPVHAHAA